jgi:hypothetical protein
MSQRLYRAQLLIEHAQRKALARIARDEGRSISDVARELLRLGLEARADDNAARGRRRARALEQADQLRERLRQQNGGQPLNIDIGEFIREMREERDAELFERLYGRRD